MPHTVSLNLPQGVTQPLSTIVSHVEQLQNLEQLDLRDKSLLLKELHSITSSVIDVRNDLILQAVDEQDEVRVLLDPDVEDMINRSIRLQNKLYGLIFHF